jgi:hypothetical protein
LQVKHVRNPLSDFVIVTKQVIDLRNVIVGPFKGGNVLVLEQKLVKMEQDWNRTIALLEQRQQMRQQAHRAHLTCLPLQIRPSQLDQASPEAVEAFARIKWRMPAQ